MDAHSGDLSTIDRPILKHSEVLFDYLRLYMLHEQTYVYYLPIFYVLQNVYVVDTKMCNVYTSNTQDLVGILLLQTNGAQYS